MVVCARAAHRAAIARIGRSGNVITVDGEVGDQITVARHSESIVGIA